MGFGLLKAVGALQIASAASKEACTRLSFRSCDRHPAQRQQSHIGAILLMLGGVSSMIPLDSRDNETTTPEAAPNNDITHAARDHISERSKSYPGVPGIISRSTQNHIPEMHFYHKNTVKAPSGIISRSEHIPECSWRRLRVCLGVLLAAPGKAACACWGLRAAGGAGGAAFGSACLGGAGPVQHVRRAFGGRIAALIWPSAVPPWPTAKKNFRFPASPKSTACAHTYS